MLQREIEQQYSRKNIRAYVRADIDEDSPVFTECITSVIALRLGTYYEAKNKRLAACTMTVEAIVTELFIATLTLTRLTPIQSVATQMAMHLGYDELLDGVKTAAEVIAVCEKSGLFTIYHASHPENDTDTLAIWAKYTLSSDVKDYIQRTQYLPPMLCKPNDWTTNRDGGYKQGSGSVILGAMNHHDDEQCLDTVNIVQGIPWELNTQMLTIEEVPNKPHKLDTDEKKEQFEKFKADSRRIYEMMLNNGNRFFFTWKNDKRGRMNSCGYHLDIQSTKYKKSIIQFKHKELLT